MKPIYRYLIAVAAGAILTAAVTCNRKEKPSTTVVTVTKTDTIVKTVIDSIPYAPVDSSVKKEPVKVKQPDESTPDPHDSITKVATKYIGKVDLDNGTIDYEITADNLYGTKFKLTTKEKIVTNTVTNTITKVLPPYSKLFITGRVEGAVFNKFIPQAASVGLMYNIKQKWGIGVEVRQDFSGLLPTGNQTTLGINLMFGL